MSFVQPQRNNARRTAGIGVAIVFHIALVWALMNGLAHKAMQALNAPIETRIVEEIVPPPPPPKPIELPPPPKFAPPPPAFVPPPEVQVQVVTPPQATIAATTATAPTESQRVAAPAPEGPKAPPAPPAPAAPAAPAKVSAAIACANYSNVMGSAAYPRAAIRLGLDEGDALIQFTLTAAGEIKDVKAIRASHPVFADNSIRLVSAFKCAGRGSDVTVQVPFTYKSE
jgi:protein TonB